MKQNIERVREVGSSKKSSGNTGEDKPIGEVLRIARRQLMTKRILIAIVLILLVTIAAFFALNGFFDRFVDYLSSLAE